MRSYEVIILKFLFIYIVLDRWLIHSTYMINYCAYIVLNIYMLIMSIAIGLFHVRSLQNFKIDIVSISRIVAKVNIVVSGKATPVC